MRQVLFCKIRDKIPKRQKLLEVFQHVYHNLIVEITVAVIINWIF